MFFKGLVVFEGFEVTFLYDVVFGCLLFLVIFEKVDLQFYSITVLLQCLLLFAFLLIFSAVWFSLLGYVILVLLKVIVFVAFLKGLFGIIFYFF